MAKKNAIEYTVAISAPMAAVVTMHGEYLGVQGPHIVVKYHRPHSKDRFNQKLILLARVVSITMVNGKEHEIKYISSDILDKREGPYEVDNATGFMIISDLHKDQQRITYVNPEYANAVANDVDGEPKPAKAAAAVKSQRKAAKKTA